MDTTIFNVCEDIRVKQQETIARLERDRAELLEALQKARAALVMEGHHPGNSAVTIAVDAAIAKATGQK